MDNISEYHGFKNAKNLEIFEFGISVSIKSNDTYFDFVGFVCPVLMI